MLRTASIHWENLTPLSKQFNDPYYSTDDPIGEVRHTFTQGINLPDLYSTHNPVIAETGFGSGLNFLITASDWLEKAPSSSTLTFISVEGYPMDLADLSRAHQAFQGLSALSDQLQQQWPGAIPGIHRLSFASGRVRLLLLVGDVLEMLPAQHFTADAWYLDGFAPAKNPAMWTHGVFNEIARLSRPGTRIASFTAAGQVRRDLESAGFSIVRRDGFARKRHCIHGFLGHNTGHQTESLPPWQRLPAPVSPLARPTSVAVIGAGIAGRTLTKRLKETGFDVTLIAGSHSSHRAGSLIPRALIAPRLVRGSDSYSRFWAQAYVDAIRELEYLDNGNLWKGARGLIFRYRTKSEDSLQALEKSLAWPADWITWRSADDLGEPEAALEFPKSGAIDPLQLFQLLGQSIDIDADISRIRKVDNQWALFNDRNRLVFQSDIVVITCGAGSPALLEQPTGLRKASGSLLSLTPPVNIRQAVLHDGYLTAEDESGVVIAGASIQREDENNVVTSNQVADDILERLSPYLGPVSRHSPGTNLTMWSGGRCDTMDHLPLAGPVQDDTAFERDYKNLFHGVRSNTLPEPTWKTGLYTLTGLGARGFQAAFLLADHLAAMIGGLPLPLDQRTTADLMPSRYQIRSLKRNPPGSNQV